MNACAMFARCKQHQPDNVEAHQDLAIWTMLEDNRLISREAIQRYAPGLPEVGGSYPGYYSLDDVIPGGMSPHDGP